MNAREEIERLRSEIEEHSRKYYELDAPAISDFEYDALMIRLRELEEENPELAAFDSPTQKVGGRPLGKFEPVSHEVPLESLNDVFSFAELEAFDRRVREAVESPEYVVEPKIDGLSVALEYKNGVFIRGATRGDGMVGEDVTQNLMTVKSLPRKLKGAPERLIVRGEVYMSREVFEDINRERELRGEQLLANPRNAAAGSMRQLDPKVTRARRLDLIVFNIQLAAGTFYQTHSETLDIMNRFGFRVPEYVTYRNIESCGEYIEKLGERRDEFPYDMDGAVVKLNSLSSRRELGSTAKAPRWAAAYKYPPEKKESRVADITVNVGRTGVLTPKAVVEPVRLAGTTVTNATLHNQDFIDKLDVRVGDTVLIQKAGEIIPEVLEVNKAKRPEGTTPFRLPDTCPECGSPVERDPDGAAMRCTGAECPAQRLRNIVHFASRGAMDIEGLGIAVAESLSGAGLVSSAAELYYLRAGDVAALDRMGEKSAENLLTAIEGSKSNGMARLLCAFGIRQVGQKAAKVLAARYESLHELREVSEEQLTAIPDIGPVTAANLVSWFQNPQSQHQLELLEEAGVSFESGEEALDARFEGKTFVLTGALERFTRAEAEELIMKYGGKASSSVSKKTSYVVVGENAGSKLRKAEEFGIEIISENQFAEMLD